MGYPGEHEPQYQEISDPLLVAKLLARALAAHSIARQGTRGDKIVVRSLQGNELEVTRVPGHGAVAYLEQLRLKFYLTEADWAALAAKADAVPASVERRRERFYKWLRGLRKT